MLQLNRLFVFAILIFGSMAAKAQTQHSGWVATFNTFKLNDRFSIHFDPQFRSSDNINHLQTYLLRGGLNVHLSKTFIATAGYALIGNRRVISGISGYTPEHRIWQQLIVNQQAGKLPIAHRFRLEQRFISRSFVNDDEFVNEGNVYANRIRYFVRTVIPFSGQAPFTRGMFGSLQNEIFFNFGDKSGVNGKSFDQNRAYGSVGYRLSREVDVEIGYMNQYIAGAGRAFTNNHIVQLAGYFRL